LKRRLLSLRNTIRLLFQVTAYLDILGALIPKLAALNDLLRRLEKIDSRITELDVLHATAAIARLESLDASVKRIERVASSHQEPVVAHPNGNGHDVKRLQVLNKFAQLSGKAREIELEWQRIQQDENDALCAFQTTLKEENKQDYFFKKGISEGVKWCVNRFS
jgi:fido (protein-threonine AMPylation protein)